MEDSDRVPGGNEQRSPRQVLIDEVNHYATLYAQVRKKAEAKAEGGLTPEEIHAKLSNHEYKLIAWQKAYELLWEGRDGHFYYYIGKNRYDLGDDSMDYALKVFKYLDQYDPDHISPVRNEKSEFTTYFARRVKGMSEDYTKSVQVKRKKEFSMDARPDEDEEPIRELEEHETGYGIADLISTFDKFSAVLLKHTEIVGRVNRRAETKRERFFAYHTRGYVLICDHVANHVRGISGELEKTLSQPYILYLWKEAVKGNEEAKRYLRTWADQGRMFHVGAIRLKELYTGNELIPERYQEKQAMNQYFNRTNLSKEMAEYDALFRMFLAGKAEE